MAVFTVDTVHNVGIDYETAGVGERILAELIDTAIKIGYMFFLLMLQDAERNIFSSYIFIFIFWMPIVFYSLFFEVYLNGQTPGKRLRKIKVCNVDGTAPTLGSYLLRWLFRMVDIQLSSGLVAVLAITASKQNQRVGDMLAGTTVVRVGKRIALKDLTYIDTEEKYQAVFPQVLRLGQEDVDLIQKVLNSPDYLDNYELVVKLTDRVATKMGVEVKIPHELFLVTVVKDYSALVYE